MHKASEAVIEILNTGIGIRASSYLSIHTFLSSTSTVTAGNPVRQYDIATTASSYGNGGNTGYSIVHTLANWQCWCVGVRSGARSRTLCEQREYMPAFAYHVDLLRVILRSSPKIVCRGDSGSEGMMANMSLITTGNDSSNHRITCRTRGNMRLDGIQNESVMILLPVRSLSFL
ncbi:hypothetical protein BGW80DRAFT_1489858 [Lactifluus volemus]|nr:hypothetical protein BGW80DRAFT_1489858 [Lactifluus volemus]